MSNKLTIISNKNNIYLFHKPSFKKQVIFREFIKQLSKL